MFPRGRQVLPNRQDVTTRTAQIGHDGLDLISVFAQPHHQARLREHAGSEPFRECQHFERNMIVGLRPDFGIKQGNRFDVMIKHVGSGLHDRPDRSFAPLEIGHEHFHRHLRIRLFQRRDNRREMRCAAVFQVVPGDRRHDHVAQAHFLHSGRNASRLGLVQWRRRAFADCAEAARARAHAAHYHERGRPAGKALADVGTVRAAAHGVQVVPLQHAAGKFRPRACRNPLLYPRRKFAVNSGHFRCPSPRRKRVMFGIRVRKAPGESPPISLIRRGIV